MLAEGPSTKDIAEILGISPRTVELHRYRAMKSLGVHTIAELVKYALTITRSFLPRRRGTMCN
jgi:DNA-binding NarL/FixJ family response regulator